MRLQIIQLLVSLAALTISGLYSAPSTYNGKIANVTGGVFSCLDQTIGNN